MFHVLSALLLCQSPTPLYKVKAQLSAAEVKVGQSAKLEVRFEVAANAHISDEAPLSIKISGDGMTFEKRVLHYGDAQKPASAGPRFEELLTASVAGPHTVDVQMSFYVCTAELCNHANEHRTLTLAAK